MKKEMWSALVAYLIWGSFPLYWKQLENVPALQILSHRVVWSFVFLALLVTFQNGWRGMLQSISRSVWLYGIAGLVLAINWLLYVWGVNSGQIVETSLGSFMTSLFTVLFGVMFVREKLRPLQLISVGLLFVSVAYMAFRLGEIPWLALGLGSSFSLYGLLKKKAPLPPLHGLTIETSFLFFPCLAQLLIANAMGYGSFGHSGVPSDLLMVGGGFVTGFPLLLFAQAAQEIPLWLMGLFQYIPPTMFFFIGVFIYAEPFSVEKALGFFIIWMALILFGVEGLIYQKWQKRQSIKNLPGSYFAINPNTD